MAELYQIVDYDEVFENYKSRDISRCSWYAKPNDMNIRWQNVMAASGVSWAIFDAMLMLCSQQRKPRLGFLTHDGKPDGQRYTVSELAMMFFQSEEVIKFALKLLTRPDINWLKSVPPDQLVHAPDKSVRAADQLVHAPDKSVRAADQLVQTPQTGHNSLMENAPDQLVHAPDKSVQPADQLVRLGGLISQPRARVREGKGTEENGSTPHHPPEGGGIVDISVTDAQKWLNSFFGRQAQWSYEEMQLLSEQLPIPKPDRALLSWAYKLPRDKEGWAIVNDRRVTKPKQSLVALLREFPSELDKWRSVRRNLNGAHPELDRPLPREWIEACVKIYGPEYIPPPNIRLLPMSVEIDIKQELEREKHASATA